MKNIDYVCKVVAKNNNLPESLVKKVNSFFWKDVSRKVYDHEEMSVFLREIGTFIHSMKKLRTEILWLVERIRIIRRTKKFTENKRKLIEEHYTKALRKLLIQHNNLAVLYNSITENQKQNKILKHEQINGISKIITTSNC